MLNNEAKAAREAAGLSAREAAEIVGVAMLTWQRWEGQTGRSTEIPSGYLELFKLKTGTHPTHVLSERGHNALANRARKSAHNLNAD